MKENMKELTLEEEAMVSGGVKDFETCDPPFKTCDPPVKSCDPPVKSCDPPVKSCDPPCAK